MAQTPLYRRGVGALVLNRQGLVFIGKRAGSDRFDAGGDGQYAWQMPQGGIDEDEDPYEAALRELYEETNIRSVRLLREAPEWFAYDLPEKLTAGGWRGRFRGQSQKWFAFRFVGDEREIDVLHPGGGEKPEFSAWRWEPMANLPALIVPFKRAVYERVVAAFAGLDTPES